MGIRTTQVIGLHARAELMVEGDEVLLYVVEGKRIYPDGKIEEFREDVHGSSVNCEESGSFEGMFDEPFPLHCYTMPDGRVLQEAVQAEPWSSGPCVFLALKDEAGEWVGESLWAEQEIEEML